MVYAEDTIAAIATPPGYGGIGVIRISGPETSKIGKAILGELPPPRFAHLTDFLDQDGEAIDNGIALFFPAPASFTGEHVLELQGHGGPVVMDLLLKRVLALGARTARPGEFSERAFLNGKIDLVQAEAIIDLIESGSANAARSAMRSLHGDFSDQIQALVEALIRLRMLVEAAIDFPEEEVDFLSDSQISDQLSAILSGLQRIAESAEQGRLIREGIHIVLAGKPNAGKSSLLNRFAREERAIVSGEAGTTRDVLTIEVILKGLPVHIIDTAGLRESASLVEKEGVRRAYKEIEKADLVLALVDVSETDMVGENLLKDLGLQHKQVFTIFNKSDLTAFKPGFQNGAYFISAKTGEGVEELVDGILNHVGFHIHETSSVTARRRHLEAIQRATKHVTLGQEALEKQRAGEILAEELRVAQHSLSEITGEFTSDDLLGRIFSDFCIGK